MPATAVPATALTRSPTVVLTPANRQQLQGYPRPPQDNGRGLHFHLDLRDESIAQTVERLKYINATWTMIYAQDELQAQRAAKACWAVGIMPVVRIGRKVDDFVDAPPYVKALQAIGVPPYVQIYNEPADGREWEGKQPSDYASVFAERWARHAAAVFDAGGYPGLQVMGKDELDAAVAAVAANGRSDIWTRAFFVQHNYGVNHPPAYPYDALNQQEHPGATIVDDPVAVLAFQAFAYWMQQRIGFVLPIIGGEGGWQFGVDDDRRYPKVIQPYHAQYHCEMFDWFRSGMLSNGEPLPDYLFSVTPWLVGGWNTAEDWWGGPLGDKTETIEAVRGLAPFVRRFSWTVGSTPPNPAPNPEPNPGPEPHPEPNPNPPPNPEPAQPLQWDARLDALGIRLTRSRAPQAWQLIAAQYRDDTDAEGKHHVYIKALSADDKPAVGVRFVVDWVGRHADETPCSVLTDANGEGNGPMFINLHPEQKDGIIFATAVDQPSDRVDGMGLPNKHHVCYVLTFRYGAPQVIEPPAPVKPTEPVEPPTPVTPPPPAGKAMNKLGFYLHQSIDQNGLWEAIRRIQPPVILIHADTANNMLLQEIRRFRAPDALVIGRLFKDSATQRQMLENDPEGHGRALAEEIINYDFGMATKRAENGRLLIDAWMSLNEPVPGPASQQFKTQPEATAQLLRNYDRFQVAFRQRLQVAGIEAVAFNFAAGNFTEPAHYLDYFPGTLASYVYLGFHEYGWPTLDPATNPATNAGDYRHCLDGIRTQYGDRHRALITEVGLTRAYKDATLGDVGWLNDQEPLSEASYWQSLAWYNSQLAQDDYALGACLFAVGHQGNWASFRHLGQDNQGRDLHLIDRIDALRATRAIRSAEPAPLIERQRLAIRGQVTLSGMSVAGATVRLLGSQETVGTMRQATISAPGSVTWTRRLTGFGGSLWSCWNKLVTQAVAGLSWAEFRTLAGAYNPELAADHDHLYPYRTYLLPENRDVVVDVVWDRPLAGFTGTVWQCWQQFVENRVIGLSYPQFKAAVRRYNPTLGADHRFTAQARYNLPRNAGHKVYALQGRTDANGHFAFMALPPGEYQLLVRAPGALPYSTGFSCEAETTLEIVLQPLVSPQARGATSRGLGHDFVRVYGDEFVTQGRTFRFIGVNARGLVHYGDASTLQYSQAGQQAEQLQAAYDMGARVVRIFLPSIHAPVDPTIDRLRALVQLVHERFPGLYILPAFANLYADVPFRIPGDEGFYGRVDPSFSTDLLTPAFFTGGFQQHFLPFVTRVVAALRDEPAIFAWEIGNELKLNPANSPHAGDPNLMAFITFMQTAAQAIRAQAPHHLVTTGLISTRHAWLRNEELWRRLYAAPFFDFLTVHCYNEEYENDDSAQAEALQMPYIVEEAGFGRSYGGDRSGKVAADMDRWFNRNARGYMQWGFMATGQDMGDGDSDSGMDRTLHGDWDALVRVYRARADALAQTAVDVGVIPDPQPAAGFGAGQTVYAQTVVNVRQSPGYVNKPADDILGQLAYGAPATITGAAKTVDDLVWWPLRATLADGRTGEGWAAAAIPGTRLLDAVMPPAGAPRAVQSQAYG